MSSSRSRATGRRAAQGRPWRRSDAGDHRGHRTTGRRSTTTSCSSPSAPKAGIGLPGAVTVKGPRYTTRFRALLDEIDDGRIRRLAFAVPGVAWPLPLYELALLTATHAASAGRDDLEISLVTPEAEPLELFGAKASAATRASSTSAASLVPPATPRRSSRASSRCSARSAAARSDRVVSLPRLHGPECPDSRRRRGLHPDRPLRARLGVDDVYAAGDATAFPVKQGGIATQQADAAAESIAALAGADVRRGLQARAPRHAPDRRRAAYMRAESRAVRVESGDAATARCGGRRARSPDATCRPTWAYATKSSRPRRAVFRWRSSSRPNRLPACGDARSSSPTAGFCEATDATRPNG